MNPLQTCEKSRLFWYLHFHCYFCHNLSGDAVKNLKKLVWISLNIFSTGDQALVLIWSKRTVLVRKYGEPPSLLLNAWMGHSEVVSTVVGCLLPSAWAVLGSHTQQWFLCLYPGTRHYLFPNQEDAALGKHRPSWFVFIFNQRASKARWPHSNAFRFLGKWSVFSRVVEKPLIRKPP